MRTFSERTITKEILDEVRCNQCGQQIGKNDFGYFEDYLSVNKTWGHGSPIDGESHTFDLCYDCYSEMINRFEIPPE